MIDIRSDTVTQPTEAMRKAMAAAPVGDDVYRDDPTVIELERLGAKLVGKKAALFVPSGTFGNQLALFTHCPRGSEVILGEESHIIVHEAGAASVIAGVQTRTVDAPEGVLDPSEVAERIRTKDIHFPVTSLICLENAHSNGKAVHLKAMEAIADIAKIRGIPVHLDGARIFNAATALGTSAERIASSADSVMFCLSKGLAAPVGSLLAGTEAFINAARYKRKIMGGGMRQAGTIAAAGIIALTEHPAKLAEDHLRARVLAAGLSAIPGLTVKTGTDINMVFFTAPKHDGPVVTAEFAKRGIIINPPDAGVYRFVTHIGVDDAAVTEILKAAADIFQVS